MATDKDALRADRVRGGKIVLRRPWERAVFIAGLAGAVLLAIGLTVVAYWR